MSTNSNEYDRQYYRKNREKISKQKKLLRQKSKNKIMKTKKEKSEWTGNGKSILPELRRIYGNQPVVDAKYDIRIVISEQDIQKSIPKDFYHCVFAQACIRLFKAVKPRLLRTTAYISLPNEKGDYRVERFIISNEGRKMIADFDRGIMPTPGAGFVFLAPTASNTLDWKRHHNRKRDEVRRRAVLKGNIINKGNKAKQVKKPLSLAMDIRNGTGLIQMRKETT